MWEIARDKRPLYLLTRQKILNMLEDGALQPGTMLPPITELAERLGVSRLTVREALKTLEEEGVVITRHGVGTSISPNWVFLSDSLNQLQSTSEIVRAHELNVSSEVLKLEEILPDARARQKLDLGPGQGVVLLERLRRADSTPMIYSIDVFPRTLCPTQLDRDDFRGSLFETFRDHFGIQIKQALATIKVEAADASFPRALTEIDVFLLLEQVHYNEASIPVLYSRDYYRSDRFSFNVLRRRS
jgi:GntR family transcriptional regulator